MLFFFFFKQKTAYEMRISDGSSDVCSSDLLSFAHNFANQTIANYDPRNRPEIFQGWLGAPIGLFQSYITNYYLRMFRLFETHNTRALASQAVWQAGIFGVKSFGPFWGRQTRCRSAERRVGKECVSQG